jgi:hypothetical protein
MQKNETTSKKTNSIGWRNANYWVSKKFLWHALHDENRHLGGFL